MCNKDSCEIIHGYCHCTCGGKTNLVLFNNPKQGSIKGEFRLFIPGHQFKKLIYYIINDETGCWEWQKGLDSDGYGQKWLNGKNLRAHRYMYELHKGPIPKGMEIDHLCKVRRCVNPEHMEVVTTAENSRRGKQAKLNWEQVREIRELKGKILQKDIAKLYGVNPLQICLIMGNKIWREDEDWG